MAKAVEARLLKCLVWVLVFQVSWQCTRQATEKYRTQQQRLHRLMIKDLFQVLRGNIFHSAQSVASAA